VTRQLRQPQLDRCALTQLAPNLHRAARLPGKALDHRQSQAGAAAYLFGSKEWIEYLRQRRFVHAGSGVADRYDDIISGGQLRRRTALRPLVVQRDAQRSSDGHRIACVDSKVQDRQFDLIGINMCRRETSICRNLKAGCRPHRPLQQFFDTGDQSSEVDRSWIEALFAGEGKQALYRRDAALGGSQSARSSGNILGFSLARPLANTRFPITTVSRLLKSWAIPPVN
jgi:hypothetical protein